MIGMKHCTLVMGFAFLSMLLLPVQAVDINLSPDDTATLQETIDGATDGDVIILSAGTFPGNIDISEKNITIRGQGRDSIIQGSGDASVVRCSGNESVLDSVSITGGSAANGGGVYIIGSCSMQLNNSFVYGNSASSKGAAICIRASGTPEFSNNVIAFNTNGGSSEPHSIYLGDSRATFNRNTVAFNTSPGNAFFLAGSGARVRMSRNIIANNGENGIGRGICVVQGARLGRRVRVQRNVFFENSQSEIMFDGRDFSGSSGIRRAQRRVGSRRFSRNTFVDPLFTNVGSDFDSSDFTLQAESSATNFGAFSN